VKGKEIREKFLKYFEQNGHQRLPSASLIPDDPTVLLTLAGMLPFKPIFLGVKAPTYRKITTVQKCVRMNDIENVGKTARHQTFFEMLGNFSFGSYFKKEAMVYALELLTKVFNLPLERLSFAVYHQDQEAYAIWRDTLGLPQEKIIRLGEDNNFWAAGPTGPCGPCSEIYYDLGAEVGCKKPTCAPGCDCDRFLELWNLVFVEFNRDENGVLSPLPAKNIDTGMGLERLAAVLQSVPTNFDTDLIKPVMDETLKLCETDTHPVSLKVVADHVRAATFLVGDGLLPSNEGRGYVLRRLIRRAVRHGQVLGIEKPFLARLSKVVVHLFKDAYPELLVHGDHIEKVVAMEEQSFLETLEKGIRVFKDLVLKYRDQQVIPGHEVFKLHDTFGFPIDLSVEIATEERLGIDREGFEKCMLEQRERARAGGISVSDAKSKLPFLDLSGMRPTKFVGYEQGHTEAKIQKIFDEDKLVILDKSPFYPESGGQVADSGILTTHDRERLVTAVFGRTDSVILHQLESVDKLKVNDKVQLQIDLAKRGAVSAHHTATHLLQAALREVVSAQIKQSGSFVAPDRLRFDFNHSEGLTAPQIEKLEDFVNVAIKRGIELKTIETSLEEAQKMGATALFGEKYGKTVRVVMIDQISREFCGGTHVKNTGEISFFKILSESAVAAGIRRIEAVAGRAARVNIMLQGKNLRDQVFRLAHEYKLLQVEKAQFDLPQSLETGIFEIEKEELENLGSAVDQVDSSAVNKFLEHLRGRVEWLQDRNDNVRREIARKKRENAGQLVPKLIAGADDFGQAKSIVAAFDDFDMDTLRQLADWIAREIQSYAVLLASVMGSKVILLSVVSKDWVEKGLNAVELVNVVAAPCGGRGGGRKDKAEAGGKDPEKLKVALQIAKEWLKGKMS